jgi:2-polyprenyl-6-hydroxyphenyl methylase/3-demethylubiquinone-9 3-methyltransferase
MSLKTPSIDPNEIEKFSQIAEEWWDEEGKFKPLHQFNPIRIKYIRDKVIKHFSITNKSTKPFEKLRFLDVGCGGGLLTIPLGNLGADILGIDAIEKNIKIAEAYMHKHVSNSNIKFNFTSIESLEKLGEKFDVVVVMEVIEHVANVSHFIKTCINLLNPNGLIFIATLNRTVKSYLLAIIGAEYILRWMPVGTHSWNKFLKPEEIIANLQENNIVTKDIVGVSYNPILGSWSITTDTSVNYILYASQTFK